MGEAVVAGPRADLARATFTITAWNAVSRATGFVRVVAMGAALGATSLGDAYQSANLVSNILFELLAGGMLSSVLVPTFVELVDAGRRDDATRLAGALLGRALATLGIVVAVGVAAAPWIMRALTIGVEAQTVREEQVHLGAFLLVFFLPQVLLYATGAVATALLQAEHRFTAAAVAPVFNNLVVIVTMAAFRALRDGSTGFDITTGQKLVLALGTTGGVLAMTLVPLVAVAARGKVLRPRWHAAGHPLRDLASRGMWAAGHLGLNQLLVAVTIVVAASVRGGVVAYQIAFTFFLLPHAVLSNPIFTALFPRLASDAQGGRVEAFARDLGAGVRLTASLLLPAAGLLAALATPLLAVVRLGALDEAGAGFVASVLAAYAVGLLGYSTFFLLTRAAYALGDVRSPTVVNAGITGAAVIAMVVLSAGVEGHARVVVLGLVHAVAVTAGAVVLHLRVEARLGRAVPVVAAIARDTLLAGAAALVAWRIADGFDVGGRGSAAIGVAVAGTIGAAVYAVGHALLAPRVAP